jgi:hypothetical protein
MPGPLPLGCIAASHIFAPPLGYIDVPVTSSNNLMSTPNDTPTIDDLTLTARVTLNAVPGSGSRTICERWVTQSIGLNRFIWRFDATAKPNLIYGSAAATLTRASTVAWPFPANQWGWLKTFLDVDNGASQNVCYFWTSGDGVSWSLLDTVTTAGVTPIDTGTAGYLAIGGRTGSTLGLTGKISDLKIENATSTLFEMHTDANLSGVAVGAASITVTSGQTMTVQRSGSPALVLVPSP